MLWLDAFVGWGETASAAGVARALLVLPIMLVAGCRQELGSERFATTEVRGSIRLRGQPVRRGWVEFIPIDGTPGMLRSAPIAADGTFRARGVAVGTNLVRLFQPQRTVPAGRFTLSRRQGWLAINIDPELVRLQAQLLHSSPGRPWPTSPRGTPPK